MDGFLLQADFGEQRRQLIVAFVVFGVFQIKLIERLDNFAGDARCQKADHCQDAHDNPEKRRQHTGQHRSGGVLCAGNAQNRPIGKSHRIVNHLLAEGVGVPRRTGASLLHRLFDFHPLCMIFHPARVCVVVIQHLAVLCHQGHPLKILRKHLQCFHSVFFYIHGKVVCLALQFVDNLVVKIIIQDSKNSRHANHADDQ